MDIGFINFSENKMLDWQSRLLFYAENFGDIFAVSDTETTGVSIATKDGEFNRVLEWALFFCYKNKEGYLEPCLDSKGDFIVVDELMNPFFHRLNKNPREKHSVTSLDDDNVDVHGITVDYLFGVGESPMGRDKLKVIPGSFKDVFELTQTLLSEVVYKTDVSVLAVFHNAPFDAGFLSFECELAGLSPFESYFGIVDTMELAFKVMNKKRMSLDVLYEWGKENQEEHIKDIERPLHTAIIDSMILQQVYNVLLGAYKSKKQELNNPV